MMKFITLTLSPALDVGYILDKIEKDTTNRAKIWSFSAGGKGINVSRQLKKLKDRYDDEKTGIFTVIVTGGNIGGIIENSVTDEKLEPVIIKTEGETRINVSAIGENGETYEINAPGTEFTGREEEITEAVLSGTDENTVVVISGSCPRGISDNFYASLTKKVKEKGGIVAMDCDGVQARIALEGDFPPDIIKPNKKELKRLVECESEKTDDILKEAEKKYPKTDIITTLGADGAFLTSTVDGERKTEHLGSEKVKPKRFKGAGDTFLATYLYAHYAKKINKRDSVKTAIAEAGKYVSGK